MVRGMHYGQCPNCDRRHVYLWNNVGICNTCLDDIVRGVAERAPRPLPPEKEEELEDLLAGGSS